MNISKRRCALAFLPLALCSWVPARVAAQTATPGIVTTRSGVDANGNAAHRYRITAMTSVTKARVRELIAARYPSVVRGAPSIGGLTFVLDAKGSYISSTARAPSTADTGAYVRGGAVFLPSEPRSLEYATFSAGEVGPSTLRVVVVNLQ
jgi:hypothetical protein